MNKQAKTTTFKARASDGKKLPDDGKKHGQVIFFF